MKKFNYLIKNQIEKYLQNQNFIIFSIFKYTSQILFFITSLLIAKSLSPEKFGVYSLSVMVIFFLISLIISAPQTPFVINANKELKKSKKVNNSFTVQQLLFAGSILISIIIFIIFKKIIIDFAYISQKEYLFLILAYSGIGIKILIASILLGLDEKKANAYYEFCREIILLILIIIIYFLFEVNLSIIFTFYFLSSVVATILFLKKIPCDKVLPLKFDKRICTNILTQTSWIMLGGIAFYLTNWGDIFILRIFVSLEEIGIYNFAYQFFKGFLLMVLTINTYFTPFISQNINNKEKIESYLYEKRPKITIFVSILIIISIVLVGPFISILYGEDYINSILVTRILLIGAFFLLLQSFYTPILYSLGKYKAVQLIIILQVTSNILLDIILIKSYGIYGAAIATTLAYLISLIGYFMMMRKVLLKFRLPNLQE